MSSVSDVHGFLFYICYSNMGRILWPWLFFFIVAFDATLIAHSNQDYLNQNPLFLNLMLFSPLLSLCNLHVELISQLVL